LGAPTLDPQADTSRVASFIDFCIDSKKAWPPFPISAAKIYRWMFWLMRHRRLGRSWKSVLPYKAALVRWMAPHQDDPFIAVGEKAVDRLRKAFKKKFAESVTTPKLNIGDRLFNEMHRRTCAKQGRDAAVDRNLLELFKISGVRVSSLVLGTDKRRHQRIVRIKNVKFLPATGTPKAAFLLLPSTKTRKSWQPVGMILRRNRNRSAKICAVQAMQRQMAIRKAEGASKEDVLFANPRTGKPYSRNVFTTRLKSLVDKSAAWTVGDTYIGRPSKYFSGISFRKAVLQRLKDAGLAPTQIASYASHKSIQAQMNYVCETYEAKGNIAKALYTHLR